MEKNYEFVEKEKPTERKGPQTLNTHSDNLNTYYERIFFYTFCIL